MLVLLLLVLLLELILGGWLREKHSLSEFNIPYGKTVTFDPRPLYANEDSLVYYTRDVNGLRGTCFSDLKEIDVLTIGGSTTDQRYITDTATWQEVLMRAWRLTEQDHCVANAGIDGHSTFGHLKAMNEWLLPLDELKPKYVLFFIGLNDVYLEGETKDDSRFRKESASLLRQNSVVYRLLKRAFRSSTNGRNELGHGGARLDALSYTQNGLLSNEELSQLMENKVEAYKGRLEKLIDLTEQMGAQAVFVTQPTFRYRVFQNSEIEGVDLIEEKWGHKFNGIDFYKILRTMNDAMASVAQEKGALFLNVSTLSIWRPNDFYDFMHMTPKGADKLGNAIAQKWEPNSKKANAVGAN